jgi:hypothetical protein
VNEGVGTYIRESKSQEKTSKKKLQEKKSISCNKETHKTFLSGSFIVLKPKA